MLDVITLGSATIDVFVNTENEILREKNHGKARKMLAYPLGSKIMIKELFYETGGGGTNTAVAFSRIGLKTGYLGELGRGDDSRTILAMLKKEHVQFLGKTENKRAGYSVILDSIAHDRTILTYKGSNDNLTITDKELKKLMPRCFYISSMLNRSFETAKKVARHAKKNNILLAFNPSAYLAKLGKKLLLPILSCTDILILNDEEAGYIAGRGAIRQNLKKLKHLGPGIVVITEGSKGVHAYDGKKICYIKSRKVKVIEATGAGDAFASGFVAAILKGESIIEAMKVGQANAESVLRYIGAKNRLLTWNQAMRDIKKNKIKVKVIKG